MPDAHQFHTEIGIFKDTNITTGCAATAFCPGKEVLRQAMAAFIVRALGLVVRPGESTLKGVPGSRVFMLDDDLSFVGTEANALRYRGPSDNVVGGAAANAVTAGVVDGTIAGGGGVAGVNLVTDDRGTVGGGSGNQAGDGAGTTTTHAGATVAGGTFNTASGFKSTVGGGDSSEATGVHSTVGGGFDNSASNSFATVGGGKFNVAGGENATVSGGESNTASANDATVAGGFDNTASGPRSTVAGGGFNDAAGDYSFAAGRRAQANDNGSFVWADSTDADFASTAVNQFNTRARGGYRFFADTGICTISPNGRMTCPLFTGNFAGTCACNVVSDRAAKRDLAPVDRRALLRRLARIPITSWSYRTEPTGVRHLGPMAQDFRSAFGLGADPKGIATVDADGVALAAIQALYRENQALKARLAKVERALLSGGRR